MTKHRNALPQLGGRLFLADGGIETTLIFHDGIPLHDFAAFDLLARRDGRLALERYFRSYVEIARRRRTGLVLESATWRASADWGVRLGYDAARLVRVQHAAIAQLEQLRREVASEIEVVVSGCVGPRGDGYVPDNAMGPAEAEAYHAPQIRALAEAGADVVTAITMNYAAEAIGVAWAAADARVPVVVSFTLETDGRLPTGQTLAAAIEQVDRATSGLPEYYMINCAHPTHFAEVLDPEAPWTRRLRGLRANASCRSHAELNEAPDLDVGDPRQLGAEYADLVRRLPWLNVFGGCCGTDTRHVDAIAAACAPLFQPSERLAS